MQIKMLVDPVIFGSCLVSEQANQGVVDSIVWMLARSMLKHCEGKLEKFDP